MTGKRIRERFFILSSDDEVLNSRRYPFQDQHDHMAVLLETLARHRGMKADDPNVRVDIEELIQYSRYHFLSEERLMTEKGFDGLERHKAEHENLIQEARNFYTEFMLELTPITDEFLNFFRNWFWEHTNGPDKALEDFLDGSHF